MRSIPYQYYFANRSMHVTYSHAVLHVLAKHANKNKHGYQINLFSLVRINILKIKTSFFYHSQESNK